MKALELMHNLEEAYNRFGDIEINIDYGCECCVYSSHVPKIKEIIIESEEFIIKCE